MQSGAAVLIFFERSEMASALRHSKTENNPDPTRPDPARSSTGGNFNNSIGDSDIKSRHWVSKMVKV